MIVKDLHEYIRTYRERDAGIKEVAGVDDDWSATAFGLQRAKCSEEVFDGTIAFEQVHVFDAAEITVERGGNDNDGHMRMTPAEVCRNVGTELTCSQMIVENRNVYVVEDISGLFDGGRRDALVAMLTKDSRTEMEISWFVVEQENTNVGRTDI
jgi:hypothetical protein